MHGYVYIRRTFVCRPTYIQSYIHMYCIYMHKYIGIYLQVRNYNTKKYNEVMMKRKFSHGHVGQRNI